MTGKDMLELLMKLPPKQLERSMVFVDKSNEVDSFGIDEVTIYEDKSFIFLISNVD